MHRCYAALLAACMSSACSSCSTPEKKTTPCDAGVACATNPGAPCFSGAIACNPSPVCANAVPAGAGAACGAGNVCDGKGACVACASGGACDAGECLGGASIACGTGSPQCAGTTSITAGTACSIGVCNGSGACVACDAGLACGTGGECRQGAIACNGGPHCAVANADAGTPCDGGLCDDFGGCAPDVTLSGAADLSGDPITPGRTCADGPSFAVAQLGPTSAVLAADPSPDCLASGDEVMLLNLQGNPDAVANVGVWETARVQSISGGTVQFAAPKSRFYGDSAGSDLGIDDGGQKVALVRVPGYGHFVVESGAVLTTGGWDGGVGGVLAVRAQSLQVDGTIRADDRGYRDGLWSRDDPKCTDNLLTGQGESIAGSGTESLSANFGGSGGTGAFAGDRFVSNVPTSSTPGHAQPGTIGNNFDDRDAGEPGQSYGVADGGLLTMGSGSGGNITCSDEVAVGPILVDLGFSPSGGIIWLHAAALNVGAAGQISASGDRTDRTTGSGGSIMLRGVDLALGSGQVVAAGGVTSNGANPPVAASPGYITVFFKSSLSGTTDPPAFSAQVPEP
jgi:hypothetical protein